MTHTVNHTPGPWILGEETENERGKVWGVNGFADVDGYNRPQDCRLAEVFSIEANAHLIAAAPELLEALENLVNDFDKSVWTTDPMLIEARNAIAKAKGLESRSESVRPQGGGA